MNSALATTSSKVIASADLFGAKKVATILN